MNSTNDTANENFMTDHGSTRFRYRRALRGPRLAAAVTVARALRIASVTRLAAPAGPDGGGAAGPPPCGAPGRAPVVIGCVAMLDGWPTWAAPRTVARATAAPGATTVESAGVAESGLSDCEGRILSGGGAIPGARVNLGTEAAPVAVGLPDLPAPPLPARAESDDVADVSADP